MKDSEIIRGGVIDIGSSSVKLTIGEKSDQDVKIFESLKNPIPIGKHTFFKGVISQEIVNQTTVILNQYKQILKEYDIKDVKVIATTAVREARNKDIFVDSLLRRTSFDIDVLTVGDVIYYIDSYLSHQLKDHYPIREKNLLIAELGSGSLDVSVLKKGFSLFNIGLPIGTLRIGQLLFKLDGSIEENYKAIREYIEKEFAFLHRSIPRINLDDIIIIDENYSLYFPHILPHLRQKEKFFQLTMEESEEVLIRIVNKSTEEIMRDYKIPREIADTFMAYIIILNLFTTLAKNRFIYILETSLSEAVLAQQLLGLELSKKYEKTNQLISMAQFLCNKYNADLSHAKQVAFLAKHMFGTLKDKLGLKNSDLLYLTLAAYLHDIGIFIHNRAHHKHTEYIISSLHLFRLSEEEMKVIACIARYHRKAPPNKSHLLYNSLPHDKKLLVQKLSAILRVANSLDRSHKQKVEKIELTFNKNEDVVIAVESPTDLSLEKSDFAYKKEFFEEITGNKISLIAKD